MENETNDTTNPHTAPIRRGETAQYLKDFGAILKDANYSLKEFGYEYPGSSEPERKDIIQTTDRFIAQLVTTWDALRERVREY